jgi:hypothetical protein
MRERWEGNKISERVLACAVTECLADRVIHTFRILQLIVRICFAAINELTVGKVYCTEYRYHYQNTSVLPVLTRSRVLKEMKQILVDATFAINNSDL